MITRLIQGSVLGSKNLGTIICFRKHHQDSVFISSFRLILLLMTVLTILFTWLWLNDPNTSNTTLFTSLKAHPFFLLRFVTLTITKNHLNFKLLHADNKLCFWYSSEGSCPINSSPTNSIGFRRLWNVDKPNWRSDYTEIIHTERPLN